MLHGVVAMVVVVAVAWIYGFSLASMYGKCCCMHVFLWKNKGNVMEGLRMAGLVM
ncbi:hypothetical protein COCC4DRAFT_29931 [Bipolaris maydis ATCC 48331]|uniref:Uncharacterized protein n=2 Tax=Cochliobolus heterostrophus TaxID=5016 RepID=M2UNU0_COCH5|nr:uncharacterized protein COCC4DRAFT_29931 [Bipolaris maydis ATCC 48331]EMD89597.1 hypothetical protein COCHEDRAFT_1021911 [Bipolaris maydis C5]ENI10190.1 hypothetical protein COCC4DRAFT_29931 [Bipolaris maydis ATCC 48331]KAJ6207444.1 hypothetical protein PSV09DRAFT_1021911 [Bipolaris maydis]